MTKQSVDDLVDSIVKSLNDPLVLEQLPRAMGMKRSPHETDWELKRRIVETFYRWIDDALGG